jgi:hypothetical protein
MAANTTRRLLCKRRADVPIVAAIVTGYAYQPIKATVSDGSISERFAFAGISRNLTS